MDFLPLDQQLNDILFDFQFSKGQFSDDSLSTLERRELAVELIEQVVGNAGPAAFAGGA